MGKPSVFQGDRMKRITAFLVISWFASTSFALEADFTGYLRGGTGVNFEGGKQQCFSNSGIPANFLRLGNECDFYSEVGMVFHHKKADVGDPVYFKTNTRLVMQGKGTRQWEPAANRNIAQLEAFVSAGGFSEVPGEFWVGKRFYRDVDVYIFDWYYYADMSGVGAGWDQIPVGTGKLAIAHLIQADDKVTASGDYVETSTGAPVLQALDLRWKEIPVSENQQLNFWGVYAFAEGSTEGATVYVPTNGYSLSARLSGKVGTGYNNFTLMYGQGAMSGLNIYGSVRVPESDTSQNRAWTARVVEDYHHDLSNKWAVIVSAAANTSDNGKDADSKTNWYEVGVRPIYEISDRFQLVFEGGFSRINSESEKTGTEYTGDRDLSRVSIAPQISFSKSIWGRPVMRAYLAHSMWSDSNKANMAPATSVFANKNAGTNFGYQFEAWF